MRTQRALITLQQVMTQHDPCQNAIVQSKSVNFSADLSIINKVFSPANYSVCALSVRNRF